MIRLLLNAYIFLLFIQSVISYFPELRRRPWARKLKSLTDITCGPVRRILPPELPFDFSPLVVIMVIWMVMLLW